MLRPRLPATILTAALSAATFDLVPAAPVEKAKDKEKAYAVVGQSTESTAATGRKPLAKRIAAANQPIRTAGPDWQGPHSSNHAAVTAPLADPDGRSADEGVAATAEPAPEPGLSTVLDSLVVEVPLPTTEVDPAIAAPGRVAEPPLVATLPATPTVDTAPSADLTSAVIASTDPLAADTATPSAENGGQSPGEPAPAPRAVATVPRVQERLTAEDAVSATPILDKVRSTLTRLPRPLGLIPAPPTAASQAHPAHSQPSHRGAARKPTTTSARIAAADGPAIEQPSDPSPVAGDAVGTTVTEAVADTTTAPMTAASLEAETTAEGTVADDSPGDDAAMTLAADDGAEAALATACDCEGESGQPPLVAVDTATPTASRHDEAARPDATQRVHASPRGQAHRHSPPPPREMLAERLRTAFARMPRPLGLVPMPEGAPAPAHGGRQSQRHPAIASSRPGRPAAATVPGGMPADAGTVAAQDASARGPLPTAGAQTPPAVDTAAAGAEKPDDSPAAAATDMPSLLADAPDSADGVADAPATGAMAATAGAAKNATAARAASPGNAGRRTAQEARAPRTIRDHVQAAWAGMPRPLGLLPAPAARGAVAASGRQATAQPTPTNRTATPAAPTVGERSVVTTAGGSVPLGGAASATTAAAESFGPVADVDADAPAIDAKEMVVQVIAGEEPTAPPAPQVVTLQIEGLPDSSQTGEPFDLTITIHNGSSQPLADVVATVFFAEGVEPVSAGSWPVRLAPGVIAFDPIPMLAAGETLSLPIRAVGVVAGDTAFRAILRSGDMPGDLTADGTLTVAAPAAP